MGDDKLHLTVINRRLGSDKNWLFTHCSAKRQTLDKDVTFRKSNWKCEVLPSNCGLWQRCT